MRQNNESILETIGKLRDVVEMDVAVARGAVLMSVSDERTLDDQDLGLVDRCVRFENSTIGVAGVKKQRLTILLDNVLATPAKIDDVAPSGEFRPETMAHFQKFVGRRGHTMRRAMPARLVPLAQRDDFSLTAADVLDVVLG